MATEPQLPNQPDDGEVLPDTPGDTVPEPAPDEEEAPDAAEPAE